jgi:hypothetical protein
VGFVPWFSCAAIVACLPSGSSCAMATPMVMPTNTDEIEDLRQLLAAHRQTLAILLKQVAKHGEAHAQPAQISGIAEARAEIGRLKQALRAEGVEVADAPNDQAPADWVASTQLAEEAQIINADVVGIVNARGADMSGAQGVQITGVQIGSMSKSRKAGRKK